jgi:hypothetical protein
MGQYVIPLNLTKREFIDPHKLGNGLKLWEQVASDVGTGTALTILLAAGGNEPRGGGDLEVNTDDPEYNEIAKSIIGRWAGDRVAIVGDYAEDTDLPATFKASKLYGKCRGKDKEVESPYLDKLPDGTPSECVFQSGNHYVEVKPPVFKDITDLVCRVIEYELDGKFSGKGWRKFIRNSDKKEDPENKPEEGMNKLFGKKS